MKDQIMNALYEHGPQMVDTLADRLGVEREVVAEAAVDLVVDKQIHLEIDGTLWFAGEVAA